MFGRLKEKLNIAWIKVKNRIEYRWKEILFFMLSSFLIGIIIPVIFKTITLKYCFHLLLGIICSNISWVILPDTIRKIFKLK